MLESVSRVYPRAEVINCAVPCAKEIAMAVRAHAYAKLRKDVRGNLLLLDTDIEALKPVDVWDEDFDIGLTKTGEATPLMPFNGGVIFAKDTHKAQGFLNEVARCTNVVPKGFNFLWYIDQLALGYVAKGDSRVRVFPEEYNYIPRFSGDKPDVYFLHYKGPRKSW